MRLIENLILVLILVLPICYLVAWVLAMQIVTETARSKGYQDMTGKLWFIGFFGLIVTPAVIVSALPDKNVARALGAPEAAEDELPAI